MDEISFELSTSGLILVQVTINLAHDVILALDTGCTHTIITSITAREMDLAKNTKNVSVMTAGSTEKAKENDALFVEALGKSVENMSIIFMDKLEVERGEYVGYLGLDFLTQFEDLHIFWQRKTLVLC